MVCGEMILVTGGAGYIGSHALVELSRCGYELVVYDNLCNSSFEAIKRVEKLIGEQITFIEGDVRDGGKLDDLFSTYKIDAVVHFAGLKAVGESVQEPLRYYDNNVAGTLKLLEVMRKYSCKKIVFSSSATVYGTPKSNPIDESFAVGATANPYGTSKYMVERILQDLSRSDDEFRVAILRYFNPVGAHSSGEIGEDPDGVPNNLMPYISQVAVGKREYLSVFGDDYETDDGTGVRDYLHVVDLADAHVRALEYIDSSRYSRDEAIFNIGTGRGYSVLEVLKAFESTNGIKIAYRIVSRRAGDIAKCYADSKKAQEVLGWRACRTLEDMCRDAFKWQSKNPSGYTASS